MPKIFNEKTTTFELRESPLPDFAWHTGPRLAELAGAKHMRMDIRSLDPDKFSYPYHYHRNAEEVFVILSGSVMLRTSEGFRQLSEGDIAFFEMGETGAHQLHNHTDKPCRYLDICTVAGLDVCVYPDSGKVNILPYQEIYQAGDEVDYFKNEDNVREKWPKEMLYK